MKKLATLLLVGSFLSAATLVKAADDLAVGDPYGNGENPTRIHKKHTAKKPASATEQTGAAQGGSNQKAAGAQEAPAGNADEAK